MSLKATHLTLPEQCQRVVLLTTVDAVSATYACALATSSLVPQNCRVVVWDVTLADVPEDATSASAAAESSAPPVAGGDAAADGGRGQQAAAGQAMFAATLTGIEARMKARRAPKPHATVTHMTQVFYGGVSPRREEIHPMLQRIEVCNGARADVAGAVATGALQVESTLFVMVLNAQSLGLDTAAALRPFAKVLRTLWAARSPSSAAATTANVKRSASLVVVADDVYRVAACEMLRAVSTAVATDLSWYVQLAYVHAMDPPALEYGSAEVAVEGRTGLSHGGTLPVLCAANAMGLLRHFPVSRSEPATITPVDIALNAALLGLVFLRCGELPECSDAVTYAQPEKPDSKDGAAPSSPVPRHHLASFAVAESHQSGEASLVWGMVGEYLMGYYGRFAAHITAAFPVAGVVTPSPILQFPFHLQDVVNFGPEPRCPTYLLEGLRAYQQRQRVTEDFHGAEVTRRMQQYVRQLDGALSSITDAARAATKRERSAASALALCRRASATSTFSLTPYLLDDFNVDAYQHVVRRLTMHYALMPYHQCVALSEVDWEAYISTIARSALVHLANCVLSRSEEPRAQPQSGTGAGSMDIAGIAGVQRSPATTAAAEEKRAGEEALSAGAQTASGTLAVPYGFPEPRRSFTNDLIYHGDERIPPFPSLVRQFFTCSTFLHRTALRPNGWRSDMSPGMTPKTLTTILAQPHIQQLMTALAARDGATRAEVEAQAKKILLVAGDTLNHPQCRTMGLMVREIFKRIYHRVNVNHGAFERLQRQLQMPRVALVFVPLHRSYVDFLILSFLLAEMQSPMPHIVAGEDFLSMGPIATLMRGSGAFFMRRTFRGDPLYAALFKEYVRQMTLHRHPLEFFMEGTRSRTGKTMAPKMGILKFVCDAFFHPGQQELDDVLFLPVSLSYDELLEANMYAKELLGVPKPKENLANFFKASSTLQRMHGSIHIHIGDAVSLRSLKEHPMQCPLPYQAKAEVAGESPAALTSSTRSGGAAATSTTHGLRGEEGPLSSRKPLTLNTTPTLTKPFSPTPPSILSSAAWHLTYQLQRNIVITPASMVAALLECLSPYYAAATTVATKRTTEAREAASEVAATSSSENAETAVVAVASPKPRRSSGVPVTVMEEGVSWLRGILLGRGARLSTEAATSSPDLVVKTALSNLHGFARLAEGMSTVAYHTDDVVTRLGVNISTNQLIHICIDEALVVVVAQAFGSPSTPHHPPTAEHATVCGTRAVKSEVLANQAQLLQRLLSTEFPNYVATSPVSFASWLECTVNRLQRDQPPAAGASAAASLHGHGPLTTLPVTRYYYFLLQLICPHLEALFVVLVAAQTLLKAFPGLPLGAAELVTTTQKACRSLYEEGTLNYAVTANKETLQHYYESLIALSLLQLDRLPPPPVPPPPPSTSTSSARTRRPRQGVVVYRAGAVGQESAVERLDVLAAQVRKFLWYPGVEAESAVDAGVVRERVLKVFKETAQASKM